MGSPRDGAINEIYYITAHRPPLRRRRLSAGRKDLRPSVARLRADVLPILTSICYVGAGSPTQRPKPMTAKLDVQTRDGVLLLTIDNPAQRNALMPEFSRAAAEALRLAANDSAVGAAVLTGAGAHFCSGGNLASLREFQDKPRAAIVARIGVLNELIRSMRQFPKPIL